MRTVEERIAELEARTLALEERAGRSSPTLSPPPATRPSPPPAPCPASPPTTGAAPAPAAHASSPRTRDRAPVARPRVTLEDLVGGSVLAWVGGVAVALGVCFLPAIAVSRGWLGEAERTALAGFASLALLAGGVWAHGRRGRTDASLAAAAAGIVGLFATFAVAAGAYELVPDLAALLGALVVGAVATALAVRWEARLIAGLGILGALLSPAFVGASTSGVGVVLLLVATAAAAGVLLWQRWSWLASGMFAVATPQWVAYLVLENPPTLEAVALMTAFGAVTIVAAVGFEVRSSTPTLRVGSIVLLTLNALVVAAIGVAMLDPSLADAWLVAVALAHLGAGFATRRVSDELGLVAMTLGVVLADVATARMLDGLPLIVAWAAGGVLFAALARIASAGRAQQLLLAGLGGHLLLALSLAVVNAPPQMLAGGPEGFAGLAGLALVAAASMVSARLAPDGEPELRAVLGATALAVLG